MGKLGGNTVVSSWIFNLVIFWFLFFRVLNMRFDAECVLHVDCLIFESITKVRRV